MTEMTIKYPSRGAQLQVCLFFILTSCSTKKRLFHLFAPSGFFYSSVCFLHFYFHDNTQSREAKTGVERKYAGTYETHVCLLGIQMDTLGNTQHNKAQQKRSLKNMYRYVVVFFKQSVEVAEVCEMQLEL